MATTTTGTGFDRDEADLEDPIQGYDVHVSVQEPGGAGGVDAARARLGAGFTSLMFKVVNQTETYLPLNTRFPRMLDGELIVVWSLDRGVTSLDIMSSTFGSSFSEKFAGGRGVRVPRSKRFDILFAVNAADEDIQSTRSDDTWNNTSITNGAKYRIKYCRVDTCTFGVTAGRHVAANSWQGTGQFIVSDATAGGTTPVK